jgi:hypothetical protein
MRLSQGSEKGTTLWCKIPPPCIAAGKPGGEITMRSSRLLVVCVTLSASLFAADSIFSGTWKLNPAKSHFTGPAPKSSTAVVQADDKNFTLKQQFVDDKGQSSNVSVEAKFDGKDYPVTGDPDTDSMALQRVNDHEIKIAYKKAGQVTGRSVVTVSKDGKTTTLNFTDYKDGKPSGHGSALYEKEQ